MFIDFRSPNIDLTFDLHVDNKYKAAQLKNWIQRVYSVAATLQMSYSELWDLPEQEFLVLEELSAEVQKKQEAQKREILERGGQ